MPKECITDYIFNWKQCYNLFNTEDEELKILDKETSATDKRLHNFINKKVHPKIRKELKSLIGENESSLLNYCNRQGQIYYNTGFNDGITLILSILFP